MILPGGDSSFMKNNCLSITLFAILSVTGQGANSQSDMRWTIKSSHPIAIMNARQQKRFGLWNFPDEPVGIIRWANQYYFFGSGVNQKGGINKQQGTYEFKGSLEQIVPARIGSRDQMPTPCLSPGEQEPSVDGNKFDRDYAGASFASLIHVKGYDYPLWVLLYHGEFHQIYSDGTVHKNKFLSYASGGLAVSYDQGKDFQKVGQLFSPHVSLEEYINKVPQPEGVLDGGTASWVEADKDGHRVDEPGKETYYYVIVGDKNSWQLTDYGFAIARARKQEVLDAIAQRKAPEFMKYYVPSGKPQNGVDYFTQSAKGGQSTLLLNMADENGYIAHPQLVYDDFLKKFILSYNYKQTMVYIRVSNDLIHWSDRKLIAQAPGGYKLFYPTLAGDGEDPKVVGRHFYVYFATIPDAGHTPQNYKQFRRRDIDIVPE